MKKIFVHLGGGAGDLDPKSNFRCGFTEFFKRISTAKDKLYVVEANPKNIDKLKSCYKNFKNVEIFNIAITHGHSKEYEFFFTEDDAPHYQVCSVDKNHVKKHYPNSPIKSFKIQGLNINEFIGKHVGKKINYLSIDLEGIDYDVLMKLDLSRNTIENISIENLHLNKIQKKNMIKFLNDSGFSYCGYGYDHNNFDYLFIRKKILWNRLISKILWLVDHKKIKYLNKFIL